jgi:hypothetical protein
MNRSTAKSSLHFQFSVIGTYLNGVRVMRVLSFEQPVSSAPIERIDSCLFCSYFARKRAYDAYYEGRESSFEYHRNTCIELVSAWSSSGQYLLSIPTFLRDLPLLFFSIENCGIYNNSPGELNYYYCVVNLMALAAEELRRLVYPVMLIPPVKFCHRLREQSIRGQEKLVIVIGPFDGVACDLGGGDFAEIYGLVEEYKVSMTGYGGGEVLRRYFIEDRFATFSCFAQRLEVEVNGRRF